jgi:glycine cleavage system aminomethyltransferase T
MSEHRPPLRTEEEWDALMKSGEEEHGELIPYPTDHMARFENGLMVSMVDGYDLSMDLPTYFKGWSEDDDVSGADEGR